MKYLPQFSIIILIFMLFCSCHKEYESNSCTDFPSFCKFSVNGEDSCYIQCIATQGTLSTQNLTTIRAGKIINGEEGSIFLTKFSLTLSNLTRGTWNKDSVNGLDYTVYLSYNGGSYIFPAYKTYLRQEILGDFSVTISSVNPVKDKIEGTFNGTLVDNFTKDSILVRRGIFKASIEEMN